MNREFRKMSDRTPLKGGLIEYIKDVVHKTGAKVYVGTDSQRKRRKITYSIVVALRYSTRGAHVVYRNIQIREKISNFERLFKETEMTMELIEFLFDNGIAVEQVELDYNEDERYYSNKLIKKGMKGWASAYGMKVATKPDEMIAIRAANEICNK